MVAIFSRPSNRGYLPLCYDSKTPLALVPLSFQWFMNRQLHPPSFAIRHGVSPFLTSPSSLYVVVSSYFLFFYVSYRQVRTVVPRGTTSLDTSYYARRNRLPLIVSYTPSRDCSRDDVTRSHKSWPAAWTVAVYRCKPPSDFLWLRTREASNGWPVRFQGFRGQDRRIVSINEIYVADVWNSARPFEIPVHSRSLNAI